MRLKQWERAKLGRCGKTDNRSVLEEFIESGFECAKVEGWKHKNASVCVSSLTGSIHTYKMCGIKAVTKRGDVYLIKESAENAVEEG